MYKLIFTSSDGSIGRISPAPKEDLEKVFGPLTQEEYEAHVMERTLNETLTRFPGHTNLRSISPDDEPDGEFRNAWVDVTEQSRIDIDCSKAKEIQLRRLRIKREKAFSDLGFPTKLNPELEDRILSPSTKAKLKELRDVTEPLKGLDVEGKINCEETLQSIRDLGQLNV